ncbi:MAG: hypothetical protein E1N59_638 [Puniceicoccaceae bacterium 5H]|nr:MAG: hypothetical protein E1N59_638 [Puniceicoccaceae bacterium 5H]
MGRRSFKLALQMASWAFLLSSVTWAAGPRFSQSRFSDAAVAELATPAEPAPEAVPPAPETPREPTEAAAPEPETEAVVEAVPAEDPLPPLVAAEEPPIVAVEAPRQPETEASTATPVEVADTQPQPEPAAPQEAPYRSTEAQAPAAPEEAHVAEHTAAQDTAPAPEQTPEAPAHHEPVATTEPAPQAHQKSPFEAELEHAIAEAAHITPDAAEVALEETEAAAHAAPAPEATEVAAPAADSHAHTETPHEAPEVAAAPAPQAPSADVKSSRLPRVVGKPKPLSAEPLADLLSSEPAMAEEATPSADADLDIDWEQMAAEELPLPEAPQQDAHAHEDHPVAQFGEPTADAHAAPVAEAHAAEPAAHEADHAAPEAHATEAAHEPDAHAVASAHEPAAHAPAAHDDHAETAHATDEHHAEADAHGPQIEMPVARAPRDPMPSLVDVDTLERLLLEDEGMSNTILRDFEPVSVDPKLQMLERSAWVQRTLGQNDQAEKIYLDLLQRTPDGHKPEIYLELANFYTDTEQYLKTIAVYERFIRRFKEDPRVPEVHLRLGMLYRRYENYQLAVDSFFNVLQISFYIPDERVESYRRLSELAQYEIAETYYQKGDYTRAAEFYLRLQRVSKDPKIKAEARLKQAYADLLLGNYPLVVAELRTFAADHPDSEYLPDSRFLLARAFYMLGDRALARREVLKILGSDLGPVSDDLWGYWLKTIGNQLANDLYDSGDYEGAHRIYHALLSMSNDPEWRWPIVYQIGMCLEKQDQDDKAMEVYSRLLDQTSNLVEGQPDEGVRVRIAELRQRAQTRLEHLQWRDDFNREVDRLAPMDNDPLIKPS